VVGCGDGGNGMLQATGSVAEAARAVEAVSKVRQDYSLFILSYTKHQYIHQHLETQKINNI
jgi:hypothetical protein